MRFPGWLLVYGDRDYRGPCRPEENEQQDFFSWLKLWHPDFFAIAIHPKNEGKKSWGEIRKDKAMGSLNRGASDIVIPCSPAFVCEIKRADHTESRWKSGQIEYLQAASDLGSFACVALGAAGAKEAFNQYLKIKGKK